jgi:hypothetical protein
VKGCGRIEHYAFSERTDPQRHRASSSFKRQRLRIAMWLHLKSLAEGLVRVPRLQLVLKAVCCPYSRELVSNVARR